MKKIILLTGFLMMTGVNAMMAQCTSPASSYDLVVTGNTALAPTGPQFTYGYVCEGGRLLDSTTCCTRWIHVDSGGVYEAGPNAYGILYLKNGATFDAQGNTSFFNVYHETGASILNYTGPQTLCSPVSFPAANCPIGIHENHGEAALNIYVAPGSGILTLAGSEGNEFITIYDIAGNEIISQMKVSSEKTDISSLLPGMYLYSISRHGFLFQGKFIVVNQK